MKGRKKKLSPRMLVEMNLKGVDHTICGPARKETPIPPQVQRLNDEYKELRPAKIPGGEPPEIPTNHRIDIWENSRIPGTRL